MELGLSLNQNLSLSIEQKFELRLEITARACATIFPKTEKKLFNHTKYQKAIMYLFRNNDVSWYRSMVDMVFTELFPIPWRVRCKQYYAEEGPLFKDYNGLTLSMIKAIDAIMCEMMLERALQMHEKSLQEEWGWNDLKSEMNEIILATAA